MIFSLLVFESILDVIIFFLGIVLLLNAKDNHLKFWWGITVAIVGGLLLIHNIRWSIIYLFSSDYATFYELLNFTEMLQWLIFITAFSLFPIVSLYSGYFTPLRLMIYFLPAGFIVLISICYILFNGQVTTLIGFYSIFENIDQMDVKLRIVVFVVSILFPIFYFFIPLLKNISSVRRKATPTMTLYITIFTLIIFYYVAYTLFINDFILNTYGIFVAVSCMFFSILYLLYEDPLSSHISLRENDIRKEPYKNISLYEALYCQMTSYLEQYKPFICPNYSIEDLIEALNTRQSLLVEAIKKSGFTGFREYINYLRIEHFKQQAKDNRGKSIKELMNESGFTSRSSFYRLFAAHEQITPKEYIKKMYEL